MSGRISPMISELLRRRLRAVRLGTKPSSAAASRTSRTFSPETFAPLNTRETVAAETPARAATSWIVVAIAPAIPALRLTGSR